LSSARHRNTLSTCPITARTAKMMRTIGILRCGRPLEQRKKKQFVRRQVVAAIERRRGAP
jgi:hypothetical protein